ncbi:MAG: phospholipase A [Proteobacteria bacterium]|nr:phospholipase A [Pseudomonadota bacterium]
MPELNETKTGYGALICLVISLVFGTTALNAEEQEAFFFKSLEPYKPIYLLNSWFLNGEGKEQDYDERELLIQFSFKKQFYKALYFGFTYKAFWQIYDVNHSRSFRDQNYNPEAFLEFTDLWEMDVFRLGLAEHESNGEKQYYDENGEVINHSRTWDRSYLYVWENFGEYFGLGLKVWVVTSARSEETQAFYHDNADMQYYMGSGEIYASIGSYPTVLTLMWRKGWKDGTETTKIEARIPIYHIIDMEDTGHDIYVQYFSGYGDSLIDYNRKITKIALGVSFR